MAAIKTNPDDCIDQFSTGVTEAGDSVKPGASTADDGRSSGSPSRSGDGAPFKSDNSEARRFREPGEPESAEGKLQDVNLIQFCKDVTCQNDDRAPYGSMKHPEALVQAADEAQTDVGFQTSSRDQRAETSSKPPPAKLHEVKPEVRDASLEESIHNNVQVADKHGHTRPKASYSTTDTFDNILDNTITLEAIARLAAQTAQLQRDNAVQIAQLRRDNDMQEQARYIAEAQANYEAHTLRKDIQIGNALHCVRVREMLVAGLYSTDVRNQVEPRETLPSTLTDTPKNCAPLTTVHDEMQMNNKKFGEQLDKIHSDTKAMDK